MTDGTGIAWAAVTIDCRDTAAQAAFWGALLGVAEVSVGDDRPGWRRVGPGVPGGPVLTFQPVPEARAGKARLHLDLWVTDLEAAIERVIAPGGRRVEAPQVFVRGTVVVMADPEGNELCLVAAADPATPPAG